MTDYSRQSNHEIDCNECGGTITVLTQPDNHPEYYTKIHVKCNLCNKGEATFTLPVN